MLPTILSILLLCAIAFIALMLFLYTQQKNMIFYPEKLENDFVFSFENDFEEVFLTTKDNQQIHALHFTCSKPKGIIFYAHGNAGCLKDWGMVADDFLKNQYEVLVYDYRSYGKSTGKIVEKLLHEDAALIYEHLLGLYPEHQIILYGRSLGSGIMCNLATKVSPRLLILETPFYNLLDLAAKHIPQFLVKTLLKFPFRNDLCIPNLNCPFHIFHGTKDQVAPFEHSQRLIALTNKKEAAVLSKIEGGDHNDLSTHVLYQNELKKLLA